jgi:disulfide bond formation protein DsbB
MIEIEIFLLINKVFAVGGVICIALIIALLIDLKTKQKLDLLMQSYGKWLMTLIVLVSIVITLIYSEAFGFTPCGLCWFERIFLYPQLIIVLVGMYLKDRLTPYYTLVMSVFGFVIAFYHHILQISSDSSLPCPASGGDCASKIMFEFGFITFPFLAAIAFAFLFSISFYLIKTNSRELVD